MRRRGFLLGLGAALAAPAVVPAGVLMPVRKVYTPWHAVSWRIEDYWTDLPYEQTHLRVGGALPYDAAAHARLMAELTALNRHLHGAELDVGYASAPTLVARVVKGFVGALDNLVVRDLGDNYEIGADINGVPCDWSLPKTGRRA